MHRASKSTRGPLRESKRGSFLSARKPKADEKVNSEHAAFPKQSRSYLFPVQDPRTDARFGWDVWLMVLIFYGMLVTPFQVSFVNEADWRDAVHKGSPRGYNKHVVLFALNLIVDVSFLVDIFCLFTYRITTLGPFAGFTK